jgi:hypothetical protein
MRVGLVIVVVILSSCADRVNVPSIIEPPAEPLVWVGKIFSGGRQCTVDTYTPPDTKRFLNAAGIGVAETRVVLLAVCAACGCPAYAGIHYAFISESQLQQAELLGFQRATPPADVQIGKELPQGTEP